MMPESDDERSLFNKLLRKSNNPSQLALATVNGRIEGGAYERADAAFERGESINYRPDWDKERDHLANILKPYTEGPPTDQQFQKYKEAWIGRFKLTHEKGHTDF